MGNIILILCSTIIVAISMKMIYDAREIATTTFSSNGINETTKTLKIVGFIVLIIGLGIIYFASK